MMWLTALIATLAPDQARYVMSVGGLPVGVVSFSVEGTTYRYRALHVFRSSTREVIERFELEASKPPPEVWWLSQKRAHGCVTAIEERTRQPELVCTHPGGGTIGARPFHAAYDASGRLAWLEVAAVRFEASQAALPARADPFADGFAVTGRGHVVTVEPKSPIVASVVVVGVRGEPAEGLSCLDLARAEVTKTPSSRVVLGVVVDQARAWPHAWVKTADGVHRDPTVPSTGERRQYLEFSNDAGQLYLELLSGVRQITRASR